VWAVVKALWMVYVGAAASGVDEADVLRQTNGHLLVCYPTREGSVSSYVVQSVALHFCILRGSLRFILDLFLKILFQPHLSFIVNKILIYCFIVY